MTGSPQDKARFVLQPPRSWLGRAGFALMVAVIATLAFFFVVVFLIVGAVLAAAFLVRWWWLTRKSRQAQSGNAIEGEYNVVDDGVIPIEKPRDR